MTTDTKYRMVWDWDQIWLVLLEFGQHNLLSIFVAPKVIYLVIWSVSYLLPKLKCQEYGLIGLRSW